MAQLKSNTAPNNMKLTPGDEQYLRFIESIIKICNFNTVGKTKIETFFYGNDNFYVNLAPKIIDVIGKDCKISNSKKTFYYLNHKELMAILPVESVLKFRDAGKKAVILPSALAKALPMYKDRSYYEIGIDMSIGHELFKEDRASKQQKTTKQTLTYVAFLHEVVIEMNHVSRYLTVHGTMALYHIIDNVLSNDSIDLLSQILNYDAKTIKFEYAQHRLFDLNEFSNRERYHRAFRSIFSLGNGSVAKVSVAMKLKYYKLKFKPGQTKGYNESEGASVFYKTLYEEDHNSEMALFALMERGYFGFFDQLTLLLRFKHKEPNDGVSVVYMIDWDEV